MSKLNVALVIGAVLLVAGASDAQAAKIRFPFLSFGLGTPHVLVLDDGRHAVELDGQGNGNGNKPQLAPKVGPDDSRPIPWTSVNYADNGDWSPKGTDQTDTGDWQQTPADQDTQWTMTTVTNNNP